MKSVLLPSITASMLKISVHLNRVLFLLYLSFYFVLFISGDIEAKMNATSIQSSHIECSLDLDENFSTVRLDDPLSQKLNSWDSGLKQEIAWYTKDQILNEQFQKYQEEKLIQQFTSVYLFPNHHIHEHSP